MLRKTFNNSYLAQIIFLTILLCTLITSCNKDNNIKVDKILNIDFGGQVNKIETLGYYSLSDAVTFLQLANIPNKTETTNGFYLYRITYKTKNYNNNDLWVSGLIAIPDCKEIKGLVSYQHGTIADRNYAPSKPSPDEGIGIASVFAGNGYILLAPDYIGLGISTEVPTYLHNSSTVNAAIDFIEIGAVVLNNFTSGKNSNLYLAGYSQGGSATAGIHRELEINNPTGLILKGSACVAGAFNLKDISLHYAIDNKSTFYLGYVANSYAKIYNQSLSTIIKNEYVDIIPTLFDGSKTADYILNALPTEPDELYTQSMLDDINNGNINWFTTALGQNETYMWKPNTKIRLFYGSKDKDVSPQDAISAYNYMINIGGNVEIINTGDFDHVGSLLNSLPEIQKWFNNTK